jgi:hypothetical protein
MIKNKLKFFPLIIAVLLLAGCEPYSDVGFCRSTFLGLIKGNQGVQGRISWEEFKAMGVDIGSTYVQLPTDSEKKDYRKAFITKCAKGFYMAGGNIRHFVDWRIYEESNKNFVVAARYKRTDKILFVTARRGARTKVIAINWDKPY